MEFRLHPIGPVLGGMMILPAGPQVLADFVGLAGEASDDLSVIAAVMTAPPLPFLPTEVHGKTVVVGFMVHAGPEATAEVANFRKLATPLVDTVERMPFTAFYAEGEGPPQPAAMAIRSVFSDSFGTDHAEAALDALADSTANMSVVQIRVLGGAVSRVPVADTAFAHRRRAMVVNVAAAYEIFPRHRSTKRG